MVHSTTFLAVLTGVTLGLANPAPAPAPIITPAPMLAFPAARLAPRQFTLTNGDSESRSKLLACERKYLSLGLSVPTPPAEVVPWLLTAARGLYITATSQIDESLTTICEASKTITPPASLSSAYSSFTEQGSSWLTRVASEAHSLASSCGGEVSAMIELLVVSDGESCTRAVQELVRVVRDDDDEDDNDDDAATPSTTVTAEQQMSTKAAVDTSAVGGDGAGAAVTTTSLSTGGAAGPRETGFVAAAAAAAAVGVAGFVAAL